MGVLAATVFFLFILFFLSTMAKQAELATISSTVRFGNGKYSFTAPPFQTVTPTNDTG
jgi:hypothetical protein